MTLFPSGKITRHLMGKGVSHDIAKGCIKGKSGANKVPGNRSGDFWWLILDMKKARFTRCYFISSSHRNESAQ
jgi:hypothetical protein